MIKLVKRPQPEVLVENKERWTDEYAAYKRGEDVPKAAARRYADRTVQEALKLETARKCAYCESRIEHIDYPHVEHILPKAKRPDLVCDWPNLTLACTKCNLAKDDYYEPDCELVNPYRDEIGDHLIFAGAHVYHRSNDRGLVTIDQIDLNRSEARRAPQGSYRGLHEDQGLDCQVTAGSGARGARGSARGSADGRDRVPGDDEHLSRGLFRLNPRVAGRLYGRRPLGY